MVMRSRARVMVPVVAFAVGVALVAVLAGQGGDGQKLVKLPVASMGGAGSEADAATMAAPEARSSMLYAPGVEYKVKGALPDLPATAPGYRLSDTATEDAIRKVADVLGIQGSVRTEDGSWVVTDGDRALRVMKIPGLPWYVERICPDAPVRDLEITRSQCAGVAVGWAPAQGEGSSGSGGAVAQDLPATVVPVPPVPAPTTPCPAAADCAVASAKPAVAPVPMPASVTPPDKPARPEGFPTKAEAEALARETFTTLGAGTEGIMVEDGWTTWEARVELRLDGLTVLGMDTSVSIGVDGVERANGWLAGPDRIGDYPLVGVEAGLERLTTPVAAPMPAPAPTRRAEPGVAVDDIGAIEPAVECRDAADAGTCAPTTFPAEPMPPVEPFVQTITGAHLALLNTGEALVPAYVFEIEGGGSIPVPAVTDEWLTTQGSATGK